MQYFNMGSLIFGGISLVLPIYGMLRNPKRGHAYFKREQLRFMSLGACIMAVYFQLGYDNRLVANQDWVSLTDSSNETMWIVGLLIALVLLCNGAMSLYHRK